MRIKDMAVKQNRLVQEQSTENVGIVFIDDLS
jgi:hypothetical protein